MDPGLHDQVLSRLWPLVRRRLRDDDEISQPRDDLGEALRRAIAIPAPEDILRSLLQANPIDVTLASSTSQGEPDATSKRNRCSPLHIAAMVHSSSNITDAILERNSDWCIATDRYGRSPLHILCLYVTNQITCRYAADRWQHIHHFIHSVLDRHPEAAVAVDKKGNTPLHRIACWQRQELVPISSRIAKYLLTPQDATAAKMVNRAGRDALLHAIHFRAPYHVFEDITKAFPESITEYKGKTPLITLLFKNWYHRDQASSSDGADGYNESLLMPRDALTNNFYASDDNVRCYENGHYFPWYIAFEIAARYAEKDGIKCMNQKNFDSFVWMATNPDRCPKLAYRAWCCRYGDLLDCVDPITGNFALHIMASTPPIDEATAERVEPHPLTDDAKAVEPLNDVVEVYPQAARRTNKDGKLPLRLAIESGRRWNSGVKALVKANPTALLYENLPLGALPHAFEKVAQGDDLSFTFLVMKETISGLLGSCDETGCKILSPARANGKKRQRLRTPPKSSAKRLFASPGSTAEEPKFTLTPNHKY